MENFTPFSAFFGGTLIGVSILLLLLFNGRMAGISGIMNGLLTSGNTGRSWRGLFLVGLILGGLLFEMLIPDFYLPRQNYPILLVALGGFLVGFGTRLGSGCTSGHGICGMAQLSKRSIVATLTFMFFGGLTVYGTLHLLGVGQ